MKPSRVRLAVLVLATLTGIVWISWGLYWHSWLECPDPRTGVSVELAPEHQEILLGEYPKLTVTLVNGGSQPVTLVGGSAGGWGTPVITWSMDSCVGRGRCGNRNPVKCEDIFTLEPGEQRILDEWIGAPKLTRPGRYRLFVRYTNNPKMPLSGLPLGPDEPGAMDMVRKSTPVRAVSNGVEIVVKRR